MRYQTPSRALVRRTKQNFYLSTTSTTLTQVINITDKSGVMDKLDVYCTGGGTVYARIMVDGVQTGNNNRAINTSEWFTVTAFGMFANVPLIPVNIEFKNSISIEIAATSGQTAYVRGEYYTD